MTAAAAIFLALSAFLYLLSHNSEGAGFASDDAIYLLMADGFSPYRHAEPHLIGYVMRHSVFPPGYPLLLAAFGGGSSSLLIAHAITTTTLVLSLLIFGFWIQRETDSYSAAMWLASIFCLLPGVVLHDLEILSEFPYLLLSLIALWLASRPKVAMRECAAIAFCVGLATVTRSAGITLIPAFAIWLFVNRIRRGWAWLALAVAPAVLWSYYRSAVLGNHVGYGSSWLSLWEAAHNRPAEFVPAFLASQIQALWQGLLADLDLRPGIITVVLGALTLLAAMSVWIERLRRGALDAWYLFIGTALLLTWPYPSYFNRLLLPLLPILFLYAYLGVVRIDIRLNKGRRHTFAFALLAALSLLIFPSVIYIVHRLSEPADQGFVAWKHTMYWFRSESAENIRADITTRQDLIRAAGEISGLVPEADCLYGNRVALFMLYSRRVFQLPPTDGSSKPFEQLPSACRYFLLTPAPYAIGGEQIPPFYPGNRLPPGSVQIAHVWNDPHNPELPIAILLRANKTEVN